MEFQEMIRPVISWSLHPQILSSVLTADLSPSRCLVVGLLLTAGCNVLASLAPGGGGEGATQLVLILAGAWEKPRGRSCRT